jgi:hypothetical protein
MARSSAAAAEGDQVVSAAARSEATAPLPRTSSLLTSRVSTSRPASRSQCTSVSTETFSPDGVAAE